MHQVHFSLQGKGGVGKSLLASLLIQYLNSKDSPVHAIDTDPVNSTLAGYKGFSTELLPIMEDGNVVPRRFDALIENILETPSNFVIDNGSSSFIALNHYLAENEAIKLIADSGKQPVIHTVITGGQAMKDTLQGFNSLAEQLPEEARLIVWLNHYFGDVEAEGKGFEQMRVYEKHKGRVHGLVQIQRQTSSTFGTDMQMMLDNKLTFAEVDQSPEFGLMSRQRLKQIRTAIWNQLDAVI